MNDETLVHEYSPARKRLLKVERLSSKKAIEILFTKGDSILVYPYRVAFVRVEKSECAVSILISVAKKRFKRAVDRNAIKRQIREVYRLHKQELIEALQGQETSWHIAYIYVGNDIKKTSYMGEKMQKSIELLKSKLV